MATITGLKLSELSTLALGSTGTLFYAASAASNSYKMYEKDLYNTLNRLHISGDYQPKNQDWRFVHKTGDESITGEKTFVNSVTFSSSIEVNGSIGEQIDVTNRILYDDTPNPSLNFNNRILSGDWVAETLYSNKSISGNLLSGTKLTARNINSSGLYSRLITGKVAYIDEFWVNEDGEHTFHNDITFDNPSLGQETALFGIDGSAYIARGMGFWGSGTPAGRPVVTGSRGGNVALASLLTGLHYIGIIDNKTTV